MAEEVEMTPVAEEPPKANPLAKPVAPRSETLKLSPIARAPGSPTASTLKPGLKLPPKPGATVNALRPGLKLPPKPGATVNALRPGLKLPPKPGATISALKPGLKLPPKPGATVNAMRPGLKLPAKPVIHKPGAPIAAAPLPKPVTPVAAPATPAAPAPAAEAPAAPSAMEQLKSVTQKLKGVTQQVPAQAILHKTGIIADAAMSDAQKESSKHKTARISLSDAMGVAPVKDEHAPMKTIRIKRPIDIVPSPAAKAAATPAPAAAAAPSPAPAAAPATDSPAPAAATTPAPATSLTQRKTLRISRPGGVVRPTGKFGIKAPATAAAKPAAAPAGGATDEVADIPDMPSAAPVPHHAPAATEADAGPAWLVTLSTLVQMAACVAIGALAWLLYQNTTIQYF